MKISPSQIIVCAIGIVLFGVALNIISFNNKMIHLDELKKAEIETTKVEYGQCVVKILETNKVAKAYTTDVMNLAKEAGANLNQFNQQLIALIGTQVIPQLSSELRANVQREIIACRNGYVGRIDLGLKPMFTNFNRLQRQFPNNLYNNLFFNWKTEELNVPKAEAASEAFSSGKINVLNLD